MALPVSILVFASLVPFLQATSFLPFLNFTCSSPLLFHSLASLLQVHPQTLFPNGHTIASVTIPRNTLLYHGRHDNDAIPSPEWLALDIEMAYAIMGNQPNSRMLTYRTARNARAIYFDGASASLMGEGTFSQMVFLYNGTDDVPKRGGWGPPGRDHGHPPRQARRIDDQLPRRPPGQRPPPHWNPLQDEYFRARELCKWLHLSGLGGKGWGYEGIVRMNAGFELIWCDFDSSSLSLISNLNVSVPRSHELVAPFNNRHQQQPLLREVRESQTLYVQERLEPSDEGPNGPGMTDPREPFRNTSNWFWFTAAAKRYRADLRIRVDPSGIFSFYEPGLRNQTQARVANDIDRLGLRSDGKWEARHAHSSSSSLQSRNEELHHLSTRRRQHRLISVDKQDGTYMREAVEKRLKESLAQKQGSSKVDWHLIAKDVIVRYNNELETLLHYLASAPKRSDTHEVTKEWISRLRQLTHWFMLPFFEYPPSHAYPREELEELFGLSSPTAQTTLERCVTQYDAGDEPLNSEDSVLHHAIEETLEGLCSTVIKIALGVEYHWFKYFDPDTELGESSFVDAHYYVAQYAKEWKEDMQELMAWLGWAEQWLGCKEACGVGEMCYVPMWPVSGWGRGRQWGDSEFLWEPVCVSMEDYPPGK